MSTTLGLVILAGAHAARLGAAGQPDFVVWRYPILTTPFCLYSAWEPLANHSSQTSFDGFPGRWGQVTSRYSPSPRGLRTREQAAAHIEAMEQQREALVLVAKRVVMLAFPETRQSDVLWRDGTAERHFSSWAENQSRCPRLTRAVSAADLRLIPGGGFRAHR